jgi:uncharacterized membrane protein YeaQ/YmgE (transglycosylase-associated protein family)
MLIGLALIGLIVGGLARLALPGPDPIGILGTIALGLLGSFVGGLVSYLLLGRAGGLIIAVLAATVILALYRKYVQRRPILGPGARDLPPRR